jgi:hypothetical protein
MLRLEDEKMKLTKAKAKKIAVEVWSYLAEHGEIRFKTSLPEKLYNKISEMDYLCPLCELLSKKCRLCPLWNCTERFYIENNYCACTDYLKWAHAITNEARAKYAAIIRDKLIAW